MNDRLDELDLPLPPRRPLPPEVRGRVRGTVFRELDAPARTRLDRIRPPLAVAASVAVLAAGAMIVTQSVDGAGDDPLVPPPSASATPEPPPMDPTVAQANLNRCADAVQGAGKAAELPDRATWVPVFAVPNQGRTVTAVRAAGVPLFCETTRTTVTVSNPNVAPGFAKDSETAALLISKDGAMAGVADPAWQSMVVLAVSPSGASTSAPAIIKDGLWVQFTDMATGPRARFTVRRTIPGHPEEPYPVGPGGVSTAAKPGDVVPGQSHPELDLPRAPEPLVAATDNPDPTAPDRSSPAGAFLGECITNSDSVVVDPAAWQPVLLVGTAPVQHVLARNAGQVGICASQPIRRNPSDLNDITVDYGFAWIPPETIRPGQPIQYTRFWQGDNGEGQGISAFMGLVRQDVATMEVIGPGDPTTVPITNGGFGVLVPVGDERGFPDVTAVLRDRSGTELFRGPLLG